VLTLFAVGLLCKPMLVTLPFVLLLLDYWPLGRLTSRSRAVRAVIEKLPLLALAAASAIVTFFAQRAGGTLISVEKVPLADRFARAAMLYASYLGKSVWPANLAAIYPDAAIQSAAPVVGAVVLLAAITFAVLWAARRGLGFAAVGWFWFLGMMVPTIGLVQAGLQVMADRFVYLPQIGLSIAVVWWAGEFAQRSARGRRTAAALAVAVLASLTVCAWRQASVWRDGEALWVQTLACTERNAPAQNNLGTYLTKHGKPGEAIDHFLEALKVNPRYAVVHANLAKLLAMNGKIDDAILHCNTAIAIDSHCALAYGSLGYALVCRGQVKEAIPRLEKAIELKPDYAEALNNLAWLRSTNPDAAIRDGGESLRLALCAEELTPELADAQDTLAAAYAETGQFDKAVEAARKGVELAEKASNRASAEGIKSRLKLYGAGRPYRDAK
jgi:tetratricopeptide (TPR) repeat protein